MRLDVFYYTLFRKFRNFGRKFRNLVETQIKMIVFNFFSFLRTFFCKTIENCKCNIVTHVRACDGILCWPEKTDHGVPIPIRTRIHDETHSYPCLPAFSNLICVHARCAYTLIWRMPHNTRATQRNKVVNSLNVNVNYFCFRRL